MAKGRPFRISVTCGMAALAVIAGAALCPANVTDPQKAEQLILERLKLKALLEEKHEGHLMAFYADKSEPAPLRALALESAFSSKSSPLSVTDRTTLSEALQNTEPPIRLMAAKLIGLIKETNLVRQVLELADLDPDPDVKAEALVSARPWTRLTHLYFLQKAVESESLKVRVEAVNSLASLSAGELNPAMMAKVDGFSRSGQPDGLRKAALGALYRWKSIEWEDLRDVITDPNAGEELKVYAIELTDKIPMAVRERLEVLREIAATETSLNLVWQSYRRIKASVRGDDSLNRSLAKILSSTNQSNASMDDIAAYLKAQGLTVYRKSDGGWTVRGI